MALSIERAYRVLGLTPGAPKDDVHRAYRDLAQVWHPDRFAHNERLQEKAQDNLRRINEAYEILRDYEPSEQPGGGMYARLSETFSAVLGLGDILKTSEVRRAPKRPGGGSRHSADPSGRGSREQRRGGTRSGRRSGRPSRESGRRGSGGHRGRAYRKKPRAHPPEAPSGQPAAEPPPVVGVDTEDAPLEARKSQPFVIWLVLALSVVLMVAAVLLL